jgi:ATP-dependent phosphofructokinase / diphosphate-dependent phosphofructokinase
MAENVERIGILTGGGDCAGLNPAIKWATKGLLDVDMSAQYKRRLEVVGIRRGWGGLVNYDPAKADDPEHIMPLCESSVRTWDRQGGTNLASSRTNPFKDPKLVEKVLSNIKALKLDALIAIGGEDTLGVAEGLSHHGVNVVGIPKTIDKDLCGTDYSLGFSTSVEIITEEIGRLRTTAGSHNRVFVVETMGRHAGHLALQGGIAGGACMVLIPEYDFNMTRMMEILGKRKDSGARYDIVVVAEGAKPTHHREKLQEKDLDDFGHVRLGGIGEYLCSEIKAAGLSEARFVVLSHLQRGGAPVSYDIRMGRAFGLAAAELVMQRNYGNMVSLRDNHITFVPITEAIRRDAHGKTILNLVDVETEYDTERYIAKRRVLGLKIY